ncbi:MAG: hypothetical protein Q4G27_05330 [Flavobacteriaceae bacterium]|nr:hypothetical protein [Flavobacteriaceae bacterium]
MKNLDLIIKFMEEKFVKISRINNYKKIISLIKKDPPFEHIDDIIALVEKYDKNILKENLVINKLMHLVCCF